MLQQKELFCCSSVSTKHFPCLLIDSKIISSSNGNNVLKSTIMIWPGNFFAAALCP